NLFPYTPLVRSFCFSGAFEVPPISPEGPIPCRAGIPLGGAGPGGYGGRTGRTGSVEVDADRADVGQRRDPLGGVAARAERDPGAVPPGVEHVVRDRIGVGDRKSTSLNPSHAQIQLYFLR